MKNSSNDCTKWVLILFRHILTNNTTKHTWCVVTKYTIKTNNKVSYSSIKLRINTEVKRQEEKT